MKRAIRDISKKDAFAFYEANRRFIEQDNTYPTNEALIEKPTRHYGREVMSLRRDIKYLVGNMDGRPRWKKGRLFRDVAVH